MIAPKQLSTLPYLPMPRPCQSSTLERRRSHREVNDKQSASQSHPLVVQCPSVWTRVRASCLHAWRTRKGGRMPGRHKGILLPESTSSDTSMASMPACAKLATWSWSLSKTYFCSVRRWTGRALQLQRRRWPSGCWRHALTRKSDGQGGWRCILHKWLKLQR